MKGYGDPKGPGVLGAEHMVITNPRDIKTGGSNFLSLNLGSFLGIRNIFTRIHILCF